MVDELGEHGTVVRGAVVEDARAADGPAGVGEDVVEALHHHPMRRCLQIAGDLQQVAIERVEAISQSGRRPSTT